MAHHDDLKRTRRIRRGRRLILQRFEHAVSPGFQPLSHQLSHQEDDRLVERAQAGDVEARNAVLTGHLHLISTVAGAFRFNEDDLPDALQEGAIGLMHAIVKFKRDRGVSFANYARYFIWGCMFRYAHSIGHRVRIPAHLDRRYRRFRRDLAACGTAAEWFDLRTRWLDEDEKDYRMLRQLHALAEACSLQRARGPIAAAGTDPIEALFLAELPSMLEKALALLPDRERFVFLRRTGFDGAPPQTLRQIGDHLRYSKENIRQIENEVALALRYLLRLQELSDAEAAAGPRRRLRDPYFPAPCQARYLACGG